MFKFLLSSVVHFRMFFSTVEYYCTNIVLYKSINIYMFSSDEWSALDDSKKKELGGLTLEDDGEFWWVSVRRVELSSLLIYLSLH